MDAIIYIRFSTLEQTEGASIDRQMERCTALCEERGWPIVATMIDAGKSAFSGKHREAGSKFGDFEAEAITGQHAGQVLVVERLSRFSRQDYNETYDLMRSFTKRGLTVATWDGGKVYEAGASIDFVSIIELLVKAKTAHEESQNKSDFGRDKWERRRRDAVASGRIATKTAPPWLSLNRSRTAWSLIEDRVALVRRIFAMADAGDGQMMIARTLNREGVPPWPRYANRTPRAWDRGFIGRIVTNPAVIGDYVMQTRDAGGKMVPVETVRGYFPRIIEPDLFERVNAGAADRKAVRGRSSVIVANLVSGLAVCDVCGGTMQYVRGRAVGAIIMKDGKPQAPLKQETAALYCKANQRGEGCPNRSGIAYIGFERALLDSVLHLSMDDSAFKRDDEVGRLAILIADRRRDADAATARAQTLWTGFASSGSEMAMKLAKVAEDEAAAIVGEIKTLVDASAVASGQASAAEHLSRLAEIRSHLYSDDLDLRRTHRSKVAVGLRSAIDRIACKQTRNAVVHLKGRGIVNIEPAKGRRSATATFFNLTKLDSNHDYLPASEQAIVRRMMEASPHDHSDAAPHGKPHDHSHGPALP